MDFNVNEFIESRAIHGYALKSRGGLKAVRRTERISGVDRVNFNVKEFTPLPRDGRSRWGSRWGRLPVAAPPAAACRGRCRKQALAQR
jgi:hypothetical protein